MSKRSSDAEGTLWDFAVFSAPVAGVCGMFLSLFLLAPLAVLDTYVFHASPGSLRDAFWGPWLGFWGLAPCVVLGYRSGRWWSFPGAVPTLVLWPLGVALEGGDEYLWALPLTAAIAAALVLGTVLRWARERGRTARHPRPLVIS